MVELAAGLDVFGRRPTTKERAALARALGARRSVKATSFVSIYERGRVIGCMGHSDLEIAIAGAQSDLRFGGTRSSESATQISLLCAPEPVLAGDLAGRIEIGTQGIVSVAAGRVQGVLLPDVARDNMLGPRGMVSALEAKIGAPIERADALFLVESERFVLGRRRGRVESAIDAAARWLRARIDSAGAIAFGVDARGRRTHRTGPFHLGRSAVVVEALAAHGASRELTRARRWLTAAFAAAVAGAAIEGWPRDPAGRAGSLALAVSAGLPFRDALLAIVKGESAAISQVAWHAAQVTSALGGATPEVVRRAALAPIDAREWAPWSALAADALGEKHAASAARARLVESIASEPPHAGSASTGEVPELALTALVAHVLARSNKKLAARAVAFLCAWQPRNTTDVHAALDPKLALGAFPLAPHADFLRSDVTAHALLALLANRSA